MVNNSTKRWMEVLLAQNGTRSSALAQHAHAHTHTTGARDTPVGDTGFQSVGEGSIHPGEEEFERVVRRWGENYAGHTKQIACAQSSDRSLSPPPGWCVPVLIYWCVGEKRVGKVVAKVSQPR